MKNSKISSITSVSTKFNALDFGVLRDDKGRIKINYDRLIKGYLNIRSVAHHPESKAYYMYDKRGFWREIDINDIEKDIISILDNIVPDFVSSNLLNEIKSILPTRCISTKELKDASNYINVRNGLLSLKTFKLRKHDKKFFSRKQLPFDYNPEATAHEWKAFVKTVFLGDIQLCRLLQEITGYILTSNTYAQKFFILYSTGSSGKSIYCQIIKRLVGGEKYVSSVTISKLNDKFARSQLYEAAVNISPENEAERFDTEAIKTISSGDSIQIEKKGLQAFTATITAKLVFCVNKIPVPKDTSYAIYRRMIIVPFLARFTHQPKRKNEFLINPDKLNDLTPELEGILAWAIRGLKRLIKNDYKFVHSDKADGLLKSFRRDVDPVLDFLKSALKADRTSKLSYEKLYEIFENYRKSNGIRATKERKEFIKELRYHLEQENIVVKKKHSNDIYFLKGIAFKKSLINE